MLSASQQTNQVRSDARLTLPKMLAPFSGGFFFGVTKMFTPQQLGELLYYSRPEMYDHVTESVLNARFGVEVTCESEFSESEAKVNLRVTIDEHSKDTQGLQNLLRDVAAFCMEAVQSEDGSMCFGRVLVEGCLAHSKWRKKDGAIESTDHQM